LPGQVSKYTPVAAADRLHQGEILAGLIQVRQTLVTIGTENAQIQETIFPFVIVLTQDCDLEQGFTGKLGNVLLCEAVPTAELKSKVPPGKDIWKRVIQNKDERYQCFESVPAELDSAGQGIPSLGCDFKLFFTVPADEVYKRIELQQITRRTRLVTPYAEHLLYRFCHFQARVPLPENHEVPL